MQGVLKHFRKKNENEPTRSISIRFCVSMLHFFTHTTTIEILYVHIITREEEAREGQKENKQTRYI
jgi:hypothetical protein